MSRPGLVWRGRKPEDVAVAFSAFEKELSGDALESVVDDVLKGGADDMERKISVEDRVLSGAMLGAVSWKTGRTSAGRVSGKFGYLNNAPYWTDYQEYGTKTGIKPLHALVDAQKKVETELENALSGFVTGRARIIFRGV